MEEDIFIGYYVLFETKEMRMQQLPNRNIIKIQDKAVGN